jgi:iron complex outermembrane receptor protein
MSRISPQSLRLPTPSLRLQVMTASTLTLMAVGALCSAAKAQTLSEPLPPVVVEGQAKKPKAAAKKTPPAKSDQAPEQVTLDPAATPPGGSLTTPTTTQAQALLSRVPGSVVVVPDTAYKNSTPAVTIKDVLDFVPGVFVQPKWGEDSRLSIRGSGLSRNFHLRGTQLFMDGIPINTADGYGDFQEIDPSAYRYVEVYKGANGLRYGANALGGAINFVTPTGRDASLFGASADIGSFGFHRLQASSGGDNGPFDFFVTGSWQEADGFRDHSWGESTRASANLGYQLSPNVETRFYFNVNDIMQRIPGSVTRSVALSSPTTAAANNVNFDWQRNVDSWRIANKTAIRLSDTTSVEVGGFIVDRHLMHPIFQWLDYQYEDYGGFARMTDERVINGFKNRLIVGVNSCGVCLQAQLHEDCGDVLLHRGLRDVKHFPNCSVRLALSHFSQYLEFAFR